MTKRIVYDYKRVGLYIKGKPHFFPLRKHKINPAMQIHNALSS